MSVREAPKTLRPGDDDLLLDDEDEQSGEEPSGRSIRISLPGARGLGIIGVIAAVAGALAVLFMIASSLGSLDESIQALRDEFVTQQSVPTDLLADELATPAPEAEDPPPTFEPTPEPEPALMLFGKPVVTDGADLWNCGDFLTWEQALTVYEANLPDDPNFIDFDGNGIPCEALRAEG